MRGTGLNLGHLKTLCQISKSLLGGSCFRKQARQSSMLGFFRGRSSFSSTPLLIATPSRALIDETITLEARFLPPHWPVTVSARMRSDEGDLWVALAHYRSDGSGVLNLSRDEAQGGSYSGIEPMGLFWSMIPAPGEREGLRLRKKNVETPYTVQISLLNEHVASHDRDGQELASVTLERWYMAPGVRRVEVREGGIVGTLFLPQGPGPFPAVLDLWGMGGGLVEYRATLLASRGFASLSLAYFGHKDLPGPLNEINVGDSYLQAAFELLQDHTQVCRDRVAIIGLSFGVFLTLRMATQLPINPRCIIGINGPIGCVNEPQQVDGKVVGFGGSEMFFSFTESSCVTFKDVNKPSVIPPHLKAQVENLRCPLLLVLGEDDWSCSAVEHGDEIEERLRAAGKAHLLTRLSYPGAGHLIEPPYSPNVRSSLWTAKPIKVMTLWGGHPGPHAAAQEDAWKKILEFLDCHLRGGD